MIYGVTLYKDSLGQLLILPNAKDEAGVSVQLNKPVILNQPYGALETGQKIKECFEVCASEPFQSSKDFVKVYEIVTGIKSFPRFSKNRLSVMIFLDTEKGYTIMPLQRYPDGSYRPNSQKYPQVSLEIHAGSLQIGEAMLNAFEVLAAGLQ